MNKGEQGLEEGVRLVYPLNYEATCPNGHPIKLSTGYSVCAPNWWNQWGVCQTCQRHVERTVGTRHGQFVAGPIHWAGEATKEEADWRHDVLDEHRCERCRELAQIELAQNLLARIGEGVKLAKVVGFLEKLTA